MRDSKIRKCFNDRLKEKPFILFSCEGAAEKAVIELLVSSGKVKFNQDDIVDGKITRVRKARDVENTFLNRDYEERGLIICRILDSRSENFNLKKQYAEQYDVFNIYTRPEIEILHIIANKKYAEFKKSGEKPSIFFKELKGFKNYHFKSEEYVREQYSDFELLINTIREYDRVCGQKDELNLSDLLIDSK